MNYDEDEHLYLYVKDEMDNGIKDKALTLKATALVGGWEEKIEWKYMILRVEKLKNLLKENKLDFSFFNLDELKSILLRPYSYADYKKTYEDQLNLYISCNSSVLSILQWAYKNNIPRLHDAGGQKEWGYHRGIDKVKIVPNEEILYCIHRMTSSSSWNQYERGLGLGLNGMSLKDFPAEFKDIECNIINLQRNSFESFPLNVLNTKGLRVLYIDESLYIKEKNKIYEYCKDNSLSIEIITKEQYGVHWSL